MREPVKIPVAVLKVGETRSITPDLEFPDAPVTFKLIAGNGPVYIHGSQMPIYAEHVEEMEDEAEIVVSIWPTEDCRLFSQWYKVYRTDCDPWTFDWILQEEEPEPEPEEEKPANKKRKLAENGAKATNGTTNHQKNPKKSAKWNWNYFLRLAKKNLFHWMPWNSLVRWIFHFFLCFFLLFSIHCNRKIKI